MNKMRILMKTTVLVAVALISSCGGGGGGTTTGLINPSGPPVGALDTTFNASGLVKAAGLNNGAAYGVAIDADGKIVVTGNANVNSNYDLFVLRLNADGTADTTFNGTGVVTHNSAAGGNGYDSGNGITIDSSGRILICGSSRNATGNNDMVIWRYNANGTLDTTFNNTGFVIHHNAAGGNSADSGRTITTDAGGKILVAGYSSNVGGNTDMTIWRYNADGTLDTTFNGTGFVVYTSLAPVPNASMGESIGIDANGKILITGYNLNTAGNIDMAIWRYNANGTLDTTFNSTGIATHHNASGGNGNDEGMALTTDSTGRILVSGYSKIANGKESMVIWRYNANGTLDTTFNSTGFITRSNTAGGDGQDEGVAITTDTAGRILVSGRSSGATNGDNMVIWRYQADGTPDTSFNGTGFVVYDGPDHGADAAYGIKVDAQGRIVVAGYMTELVGINTTVRKAAIWRYN